MLVLFERFVAGSRWLRTPLLILFVLMLGVSAWMLVMAPIAMQDRWLIPAILLTLWLLLAFSCQLVFANVPAPDYEKLSWTGRIRRKLARAAFHLLAWAMGLISLALIVVSFQLLMAWLRTR